MSDFAIMNKELNAYSLQGDWQKVSNFYESMKEHHLSETSSCYGDVLVEMFPKLSGIRFTFTITKHCWEFKPKIKWKYEKSFDWLWFLIKFETLENDFDYKVIRDHLNEI